MRGRDIAIVLMAFYIQILKKGEYAKMNKIIITYDLCGANKNYDDLIARIKKYPTSLKLNKSSWLIKTIYNCVQVRDELKKYIDQDDMLFVALLNGEAAWTKTESISTSIKSALES